MKHSPTAGAPIADLNLTQEQLEKLTLLESLPADLHQLIATLSLSANLMDKDKMISSNVLSNISKFFTQQNNKVSIFKDMDSISKYADIKAAIKKTAENQIQEAQNLLSKGIQMTLTIKFLEHGGNSMNFKCHDEAGILINFRGQQINAGYVRPKIFTFTSSGATVVGKNAHYPVHAEVKPHQAEILQRIINDGAANTIEILQENAQALDAIVQYLLEEVYPEGKGSDIILDISNNNLYRLPKALFNRYQDFWENIISLNLNGNNIKPLFEDVKVYCPNLQEINKNYPEPSCQMLGEYNFIQNTPSEQQRMQLEQQREKQRAQERAQREQEAARQQAPIQSQNSNVQMLDLQQQIAALQQQIALQQQMNQNLQFGAPSQTFSFDFANNNHQANNVNSNNQMNNSSNNKFFYK